MTAPTTGRALLATLGLLLACAAPAFAAWPNDPFAGNVPFCTAAGLQTAPAAVPDGAGGVIVAWYDGRGAAYDIYAQRISAAGVPLWAADGVPVCTATNVQVNPVIVADGAGGAVIAWQDMRASGFYDVYVQRVNASGSRLWTLDGVLLCSASNDQLSLDIVGDGAGGAIVAWEDYRGGATRDVYARAVNAAGTPQWTANGVALCTAANTQQRVAIASDGAGGAIVAWEDFRSGTQWDVYTQRVSAAGAVSWTANGAGSVLTGDQTQPAALADGSGGAFLAWTDTRGADQDVYASRVNASGSALWGPSGALVCDATGNQSGPVLASDGAGGVILAWRDDRTSPSSDVYAQRMLPSGAARWTANGVVLGATTGYQLDPHIVADGAGGAIVAWSDSRYDGSYDLFAQRVSGVGVTLWVANGAMIAGAYGSQSGGGLVSDGAGGAILAWSDGRDGANRDLYAQRIERYGQLGNPEPAITAVKDVKNDQGGFVKVSWAASYLDVEPTFGVLDYRLWRSVPAALVQQQALARAFSSDPDAAAANGGFLVLPNAAQDYAWEIVGTQSASGLAAYSFVAATTADSVPGSFPKTAFMVEARTSTSIAGDHWYSAADSGYSVDNLAPAAPAPFTGQYAPGATALHWNPNTEGDLAGYRLYRGTSLAFVPAPGNLVATLPDTGYVDAAGAPFVYKLTAVDAHGNESPVATLLPSGALGVGDAAPRAFLELAGANPSRGPAALRFGLATAGRVSLALYDAAGRRVRTLAGGTLAAGEHALAWDGRDDDGRAVSAGLYFARLDAPGFRATRRIVRAD